MTRTEKQKESIPLFLKRTMLNLSQSKPTSFTESITIHKSILPTLKESLKSLIGETSQSLSSTVWKTLGQVLKANSAESLMDLKNMSTSRTHSRESNLNFHLKYGDFTTETRSETFQPQKPTETNTKTKSDSLLFQDSACWVNGSATGKSGTTCPQMDTCTMKEASSNSTTSISNILWKRLLLKITTSRLFYQKEPLTLKLKLVISNWFQQGSKRATDSSTFSADQLTCSKISENPSKRNKSKLIMNLTHYQAFTSQSFFSFSSSSHWPCWLLLEDSNLKLSKKKSQNDLVC